MNISIFMQVFSFLITNRDMLKQIIGNLESLIPDAPGYEKATAVKNFIAQIMGIEAQIENVWPTILPFFNLLVTSVKSVIAKPA